MQLWRCLQGMRRNKTSDSQLANSSNNNTMDSSIIPFRESKLTHLLMPILSRAGSGGVSMVACVNPHVDDYDETLSILGNASLALKIKEFASFNRTAQSTAQLSMLLPPPPGEKQRSSTATVTASNAAGNKRRWGESNIGSLSSSINNNTSCSGTTATLNSSLNNSKKIVSKVPGRPSSNNLLHHQPLTSQHHQLSDMQADEASCVEMDRMRREMEVLRQENLRLAQSQMSREAEIRMEVSQEMADRSNHLLDQIQDLRDQLHAYENQKLAGCDIKKSAKKARKQQLDVAQEGASRDLQEAEEELERVKSNFEAQIASLTAVKAQLELELNNYRDKHNLPSSESASEFALRLQRDQRFQKENTAGGGPKVSFGIPKKSPSRSPLSTVTSKVTNSPIHSEMMSASPCKWELNNNSNNVNTTNGGGTNMFKSAYSVLKKATSPQRIRMTSATSTDENQQPVTVGGGTAVTYMTRLRSNASKY